MSGQGVLTTINIDDSYQQGRGVKLPPTNDVTSTENKVVVCNRTIHESTVHNVDGSQHSINPGHNLEFTAAKNDRSWRLSSGNTYNNESGVGFVTPPPGSKG
ncbi:hypothetical protein [Pseudomonas helvetica]|uniref:hypothetical protein n=1 Tax=Pseudomonas helvetica TaxID=3136738 RepID=UPI0032678106